MRNANFTPEKKVSTKNISKAALRVIKFSNIMEKKSGLINFNNKEH